MNKRFMIWENPRDAVLSIVFILMALGCMNVFSASFVRAESSSRYRYVAGADPTRLTRLLRSGQLETDDAKFAADEAAENEVLDTIARRDWEALKPIPPSTQSEPVQAVRRRWMFRPIDTIRGWMPVGDR